MSIQKLCVVSLAAGLLFLASNAAAQTLAVFDLQAEGMKVDNGLRERLGDFLGIKLSEAGHRVIGADRFREQAKGMRKCKNYACRIKLARWLGASQVLVTKLLKFGAACQVTAELRDVDAEASLWAGTVETDCSDETLMRAIEKLSKQIVTAKPARSQKAASERVSPRPEPPPQRLPANSLSQRDIRQYLKIHKRRMDACAERGRSKGVMWVRFTIDPSGEISDSEVLAKKFRGSPAAQCVAEVLANVRFPAFEGEPVVSKLSLTLGR